MTAIVAFDVRVLHQHSVLAMVLTVDVFAHALEHRALQHDSVGAIGGIDVAQGKLVERAGITVRRIQLQAGAARVALIPIAGKIELLEEQPTILHALHALIDDHVGIAGTGPIDLGKVAVGTPRAPIVVFLPDGDGPGERYLGARVEHRNVVVVRTALKGLGKFSLVTSPDESAARPRPLAGARSIVGSLDLRSRAPQGHGHQQRRRRRRKRTPCLLQFCHRFLQKHRRSRSSPHVGAIRLPRVKARCVNDVT